MSGWVEKLGDLLSASLCPTLFQEYLANIVPADAQGGGELSARHASSGKLHPDLGSGHNFLS